MAVEFINSNIALFGSDLEKKVKETSAACEEQWRSISGGPALRVWRVEKFHVKDWSPSLYGQFHTGDSYIVLKRKESVGPNGVVVDGYDVHFWLGNESSIDERGTAAYKTVELDTYLKGVPVEYREEESKESALFRGYFGQISYLPGGVESGFRHVPTDEYADWKPVVHDLVDDKTAPDDSAVTVLDLGKEVYVWEGETSRHDARLLAAYSVFALRNNRPKITVTFDNDAFLASLKKLKV